MNCCQKYVMTYAQFVNKSPHKSVHDDLVAFLKAKFAMICYENFCHERCFVMKILADEL